MDHDLWQDLPVAAIVVGDKDRIQRVNPAAEILFNMSGRLLQGRNAWQVLGCDHDPVKVWRRVRSNQADLTIAQVRLSPFRVAPFLANLHIAPFHDTMLLQIAPLDPGPGLKGAPTRKVARSAIGLAQMMAHEIKNPLAGISGAAQLLAMSGDEPDPSTHELTDLIVEECRRITTLLAQVEEFGNLLPAARHAVNIHDVLDRAARSAALGGAAHMTIRRDYDPSLPDAYFDPDHLLQVVLNLIQNAGEAAPGGGQITMRSYYDAGLIQNGQSLPLHIDIADDGPGLPPDLGEQVFDPFVSGRENGTGLGLALVSRLMGDNGGRVAVQSRPGRTVFRLSLPRAARKE